MFDALDLFHSRYPNVRLKILTGSNNGTLEKLKNGLVHLAFVSTPFNASGAFKISRIKKFHDILIAGKDFDDLRGKTLSVQDLIRYPFVCLRHGMQLRKFIDDRFAERNLIITPDAEADGADLLVPMIQHNLGLGFVPEAMAEDAVGRGEVFRHTAYRRTARALYLYAVQPLLSPVYRLGRTDQRNTENSRRKRIKPVNVSKRKNTDFSIGVLFNFQKRSEHVPHQKVLNGMRDRT